MARPQVPDSTVLVDLVRRGRGLSRFLRGIEVGATELCAVVLAELYAGTRFRDEARTLDEIYETARRSHHLVTPSVADWILAGRLLNRWSRLHGAIEPRDHLADVLIVVSAARLTGDVVSANRRHMAAWVELARRGGLDVGLAE